MYACGERANIIVGSCLRQNGKQRHQQFVQTFKACVKEEGIEYMYRENISIIKELETCTGTVVANRYGVAMSTISSIKKNRKKLFHFQQEILDMGTSKKVKVTKLGCNTQYNKAVYKWLNVTLYMCTYFTYSNFLLIQTQNWYVYFLFSRVQISEDPL